MEIFMDKVMTTRKTILMRLKNKTLGK